MKKLCTSILTLLLVFLMTATVFASNLNNAKNDLNDVSKDIKGAKQEIKNLESEQEEVRGQLELIEENLKAKEQELAAIEKDLKRSEAELEKVENELQETEDELIATQESLELLKKQLEEAIQKANEQEELNGERLRSMYMNSSSSYLEIVLEAQSFNDLLDRINLIKQMVSYDQQVFDTMQQHRDKVDESKQSCEEEELKILECKKEIEENKAILEQKHEEIKQTRKRISQQRNQIQATQNEKESLLKKLSEKETDARNELDQMEKESKELEDLIRKITAENKRKAEEAARKKAEEEAKNKNNSKNNNNSNNSSRGSANSQGNLWPVPSSTHISSPFGMRLHPIAKVNKMHKGIDISGGVSNKAAVAMRDGVVILSQYYGTYGNCVIIDHGDGISTLYAHGWSTTVSVGQEVKRGDKVLNIGSTGSSTGPHLHFEVRKNGTPVNPLNYVSR
ncbi:MAG: peptidoglycan DD-metalloendopeptidase family protein [Clostridiales bacterium]|nr:peptidoglycan DD-metalloendopeptidase family protein [Clostridiales bacterium]